MRRAGALVLAGTLAAPLSWAQPAAPPEISRGPMVARVGPTGATIAWQTARPGRGLVRWGKTPDCPSTARAERESARQEVALTGLAPATRYHYWVSLDGTSRATPVWTFQTAPAGQAAFRFALLGDSGGGKKPQHAVAQAILAARPAADFLVHGGDLIYPAGADADYPEKFFRPYKDLLPTRPFYGCIGNHDDATDDAQPYLDNLVLPDNNPGKHERWYSFEWGGSRFLCLDSTRFGGSFERSGQKAWIESQLAKKSWPGWTIVFFHHPLYGAMSTRYLDDMLRRVRQGPLLEEWRVDLVLNGHDHYYHRSHPQSAGGRWSIVHVISGGGGRSLYEGKPRSWTAAYRSAYHYVFFEVESATRLRLEAREVDPETGQTKPFDSVRLERTEQGTRVLPTEEAKK